jgi:sigma-E factor negative regulatory protein RseB
VLHLTYTDGLSIVSVFQQRGHLDVGGLDGFHPAQVGAAKVYVQDGVPYRATWSAAGIVYTVVGDAPDEVAEGIMAAFPHEATSTGVMARLTSGVGRVASWFNPFG